MSDKVFTARTKQRKLSNRLSSDALFSATDGNLLHSLDVKHRITQARYTADGQSVILGLTMGQPSPKTPAPNPWGRLQLYKVQA